MKILNLRERCDFPLSAAILGAVIFGIIETTLVLMLIMISNELIICA
jgi:uncharacterized integral membrane protein